MLQNCFSKILISKTIEKVCCYFFADIHHVVGSKCQIETEL